MNIRDKNSDSQVEAMLGKAAIEVINKSAFSASKDIDWLALKDRNLDRWIDNAINRSFVPTRRKKNMRDRVLVFAAITVLAFFTTAFVVIATVEPARAALIRFIIERFPQYSHYSIFPNEQVSEKPISYIAPEYIPKGFTLSYEQSTLASKTIQWKNHKTDQFVQFLQTNGESALMLDTENAKVYTISIKGRDAEVIEKDNVITIQVFLDDAVLAIVGNISLDEAIKMVSSIPGI